MKAYKKTETFSYSLGAYPTFELLHHKPNLVHSLYFSQKIHKELLDKLKAICDKNAIPYEINEKGIQKLGKKENIYVAAKFEKFFEKLEDENHILLYQPENLGNLGTILRSALGFEYKNIALITPCADSFDPRVIRASMGAIFSQKIYLFSSFEEYQEHFKRPVYSFYLENSSPLSKAKIQSPHTLFFGKEGAGLPEQYQKQTTSLRIESSRAIDSLNLPMAATIAMYYFYSSSKK